jgi:hypothetical protein
MITFYLILNGHGQPIYNLKTGQLLLFMTEVQALKHIQKNYVKNSLAGKTRTVVKRAVMVDL